MRIFNKLVLFAFGMLLLSSLSSCEFIGGVFKAGVWSGVILVVAGIGLVIFIIAKLFGGKKQ